MKKMMILGLALALVGGAAYANFCARDFVPAATLLVPYAVVGLDASGVPDPNQYTTILDVTNVSSAKQIIHIVVWDALSEPVVDFDEVLSGYDVWQINFRDLLTGSFNLFDTGEVTDGSGPNPPMYPQIGGFWKGASELGTQTSTWAGPWATGWPTQYGPSSNSVFTTTAYPPGGPAPQLAKPQDVGFPVPATTSCNFPYGPLPGLGPTITGLLQAAIIPGLPQDGSDCLPAGTTIPSPDWLINTSDNPVWFYVTIDVVSACNQNFPNQQIYWTPTLYPIANNVLIGNIFYLSPAGNYSDSIPAVAIEADFDWPIYAGWNGGKQTTGFYSNYTEGFVPAYHDFHEPLATAYAFEYYNGAGITSNLMVWKNYTELEVNAHGVPVAWDACLPYIYYAWDQNENCKARGGGGPSGFGTAEPNALPYQTQKVPLTPSNFDGIPSTAGWILLVFDPSILGAASLNPDPLMPEPYFQAWAGVQYYWGTYSTEVEAAVLGNYWCFSTDILPALNTYNGSPANGVFNYVSH